MLDKYQLFSRIPALFDNFDQHSLLVGLIE